MEISSEGKKRSRNPSLGWICRDKRNLYLVLKTSDKEPSYDEKKGRWDVYNNLSAELNSELYPEVGQGKKKEFRAETRNTSKPRYKIENYNISKGPLEDFLNNLSDKDYEIVSTTMSSDKKALYFIIKYYD